MADLSPTNTQAQGLRAVESYYTPTRPDLGLKPTEPTTEELSRTETFGKSFHAGFRDIVSSWGDGLNAMGSFIFDNADESYQPTLKELGKKLTNYGDEVRIDNAARSAEIMSQLGGPQNYKEFYKALGQGELDDAWVYTLKALGRNLPMLGTYLAAWWAKGIPASFALSNFYHGTANRREQLTEAGVTDPKTLAFVSVANSLLDVLLIGKVSRMLPGGQQRYNKWIAKNADNPWFVDKLKGVMGAIGYGGGVEAVQEFNNTIATRYVKEGQIEWGWDDVFSDRVLEGFTQGALVAAPFGMAYRSPQPLSDQSTVLAPDEPTTESGEREIPDPVATPPTTGVPSWDSPTRTVKPSDPPIIESTPPAGSPLTPPAAPKEPSKARRRLGFPSNPAIDLPFIVKRKIDTAPEVGRDLGGARARAESEKEAAAAAPTVAKEAASEAKTRAKARLDKAIDRAETEANELVSDYINEGEGIEFILERGEDHAQAVGRRDGPAAEKAYRNTIKYRINQERKNRKDAEKDRKDREASIDAGKVITPEYPIVIEDHPLIGMPSVRSGSTAAAAIPEIVVRVETREGDIDYVVTDKGSAYPVAESVEASAPKADEAVPTTDPLDATVDNLRERFGEIFTTKESATEPDISPGPIELLKARLRDDSKPPLTIVINYIPDQNKYMITDSDYNSGTSNSSAEIFDLISMLEDEGFGNILSLSESAKNSLLDYIASEEGMIDTLDSLEAEGTTADIIEFPADVEAETTVPEVVEEAPTVEAPDVPLRTNEVNNAEVIVKGKDGKRTGEYVFIPKLVQTEFTPPAALIPKFGDPLIDGPVYKVVKADKKKWEVYEAKGSFEVEAQGKEKNELVLSKDFNNENSWNKVGEKTSKAGAIEWIKDGMPEATPVEAPVEAATAPEVSTKEKIDAEEEARLKKIAEEKEKTDAQDALDREQKKIDETEEKARIKQERIDDAKAKKKAPDTESVETDTTADQLAAIDVKIDALIDRGAPDSEIDALVDRKAAIEKKAKEPQKDTAKLPTTAKGLLGMDPSKLVSSFKRTPKKGGWDIKQLRAMAKEAGLPENLTKRDQIVEELMIWIAAKNSLDAPTLASRKPSTRIIKRQKRMLTKLEHFNALSQEELSSLSNEELELFLSLKGVRTKDFLASALSAIRKKPTESRADRITVRDASVVITPSQLSEATNNMRAEMNSIFGNSATAGMVESGFINFIKRDQMKDLKRDWASRDTLEVQAWVDPLENKAYFVMDNINPAEYRGLIFHEIGVHFGKNIFSANEWGRIKKAVLDLWVKGDPEITEAFNKAFAAGYPEITRLEGVPEVGDSMAARFTMALTDPQRMYELGAKKYEVENASHLWEEVLAYYVEANPPEANPSLFGQIQKAIERFLESLIKYFDPDYDGSIKITPEDLKNTVAYMALNSPAEAMKRTLDTDVVLARRLAARERFLEGSIITEPMYHGRTSDYNFPLKYKTELGLHVGTPTAATMAVSVLKFDGAASPSTKVSGYDTETGERVRADSPDILKNNEHMKYNTLTLLDSEGVTHPVDLNFYPSRPTDGRYSGRIIYDPSDGKYIFTLTKPDGSAESMDLSTITDSKTQKGEAGLVLGESDNASMHSMPGSNIVKGYVNIKNPLRLGIDLQVWEMPSSWAVFSSQAARNRAINDWATPAEIEAVEGYKDYNPMKTALSADDYKDWSVFINKEYKDFMDLSDSLTEGLPQSEIDAISTRLEEYRSEFSPRLTEFLKSKGYDAIEYVNFAEDKLSKSYILLGDGQFKSISSLDYNPKSWSIAESRKLNDTDTQANKTYNSIAQTAVDSFSNSMVGQSKAWQKTKQFGRLFDPWLTLEGSNQLRARRYMAQGEIGIQQNISRQIYDIFDQASQKEKKSIYQFFTTRDASDSLVPNRNVDFATRETFGRGRRLRGRKRQRGTVNMREKAVEVKGQIEALGKELVDKGLMDEARYEELKNRYLPNTYLRYLIDPDLRRSLGAGLRPSSMDYTKARKMHDQWIADVLWGKVEDPAFLASRYYGQVTRDLAIVKYLEWIATDPAGKGWVIPTELVTWRGSNATPAWLMTEADNLRSRSEVMRKTNPEVSDQMTEAADEMVAAARTSLDAQPKDIDIGNYRQIPKQNKFGKFGGMHVRKEIYQDVMGLSDVRSADNPLASLLSDTGWGGMIQRTFKYTRVIMNPPTQIRNLISNMVLLHTSGVPMYNGDVFRYLSKAMGEIVNDGKFYAQAQEYGIEGTSFTAQEIGRIDREYRKVVASASTMEGVKARAAVFFDDYINPLGRFYQKSEVVFKLAKFIHNVEVKKMQPDQAAISAQDAILDYSAVSETVRWLRRVPFGAPFITFNVKVLPQLMKNLKNNPASFIPYVALPFMYAAWLSDENDVTEDDFEKLKNHLGEWARDRDNMYFLPHKDDNGKWTLVDIGYMLPWTGWWEVSKDVIKGELGEAYRGTGFFTGPIDLLIGMKTNHDPFTNQPIWDERDPPQQRYEDLMHFMASYMVPPFLMPRNKAGDLISGGGPIVKMLMATDAIDGNVGKDGLPRYTVPGAIMSMFGVNTYKLNAADQLNKNIYFANADIKKSIKRAKRLMEDPSISQAEYDELYSAYLAHIENQRQDLMDYIESVSGIDTKLY